MTAFKTDCVQPFELDYNHPLASVLTTVYPFADAGFGTPAVIPDLLGNHDIDMTYGVEGGVIGDGALLLADNGNATLNTWGNIQNIDLAWSTANEGLSRIFLADFIYNDNGKNFQYLIMGAGFQIFYTKSTNLLSLHIENRSSHRIAASITPVDGTRYVVCMQLNKTIDEGLIVINGDSRPVSINGSPFNISGASGSPAEGTYVGRQVSWDNYYGWDGHVNLFAMGYGITGYELDEQTLIDITNDTSNHVTLFKTTDEKREEYAVTSAGTTEHIIVDVPTADNATGDYSFEIEVRCKVDEFNFFFTNADYITTTNMVIFGDIFAHSVDATEWHTYRYRLDFIGGVKTSSFWVDDVLLVDNQPTTKSRSPRTLLLAKSVTDSRAGSMAFYRHRDFNNAANNRLWIFDRKDNPTVVFDEYDNSPATLVNSPTFAPVLTPIEYDVGGGNNDYPTVDAAINSRKNQGKYELQDIIVHGIDTVSVLDTIDPFLSRFRVRGANPWVDRTAKPLDGIHVSSGIAFDVGMSATSQSDTILKDEPIVLRDLYIESDNDHAVGSGYWTKGSNVDIADCDIYAALVALDGTHQVSGADGFDIVRVKRSRITSDYGAAGYGKCQVDFRISDCVLDVCHNTTDQYNRGFALSSSTSLNKIELHNLVYVNNTVYGAYKSAFYFRGVAGTTANVSNVLINRSSNQTFDTGTVDLFVNDITYDTDFSAAFNVDGTIESTWGAANLEGKGWNGSDIASAFYAQDTGLTEVTVSYDLNFNLIGRVETDYVIDFSLLTQGEVTSDYNILFNLLGRVETDYVIDFSTIEQITKNYVIPVNLLGRVETDYVIDFGALTQSITSYNLNFNLTGRVETDYVNQFNLLGRVETDYVIDFSLLTQGEVITDYNILFNLLGRVETDYVIDLNLQGRVEVTTDYNILFNLLGRVETDYVNQFNLLGRVETDYSLNLSLHGRVETSYLINFNTLNTVETDYTIVFNVDSAIIIKIPVTDVVNVESLIFTEDAIEQVTFKGVTIDSHVL